LTAAYIDSSAILAIALGEPGAAQLRRRIDRFDGLYSSNLAEAEIRSALVRENVDVSDPARAFAAVAWVLPDRPLSAEIGRVLSAGRLRGADLWHLACALYLEPDPDELVFLTLDLPQRAAASRLGFSV
jgi:predicted nucleic acid-binding protein